MTRIYVDQYTLGRIREANGYWRRDLSAVSNDGKTIVMMAPHQDMPSQVRYHRGTEVTVVRPALQRAGSGRNRREWHLTMTGALKLGLVDGEIVGIEISRESRTVVLETECQGAGLAKCAASCVRSRYELLGEAV